MGDFYPLSELHNINAHTKFGENPDIYSSYCPEMKIWMHVHMTDGHTNNQLSNEIYKGCLWQQRTLRMKTGISVSAL